VGRNPTSIRVDAWSEPHGPVLDVNGCVVRARYPGDVWSSFPLRGRLLRELAFLVSLSVPVIAGDRRPRSRLGAPRAGRRYARWLDREIPGLVERQPGAFLGRRAFRRVRWRFAAERELPADEPSPPTDPGRALLANSLGTDSLTSLLIGREMGLELSLAHYRELAVPEGGRVSDDDLAACAAVTGRPTALVTSDLHEACRPERYGGEVTVLTGVLMLPRLCLLMLPFVYHARAGNLVVGCELDLAFEWRLWPFGLAHERWMQSPVGLSKVDEWIAQLTDGQVRVVTLLGSLHDIA
jgi:hypothetical protein